MTNPDWDQHWQEYTPSAEIGPANGFRRRIMLRLLDMPHDNASVRMLEIGSGTGEFAAEFTRRYPKASFLGLELSRVGVEVSARRVPSAQFLQRNLLVPIPPEELPETRSNFAVCSEVLEHLDEPAILLRNAAACMAPGCKIVVTVPGGPMSAFDRYIGHRKHYRPEELKATLQRAGFTVEAAYGAGFPFFNLYRATIILRGGQLRNDISGSPSLLVRAGMMVFDFLFRLNFSMRGGWQTIAVARYRGPSSPGAA